MSHDTSTQNEEWRDIPGWEGYYQASDQGRVRSLDRMITYPNGEEYKFHGTILSPSKNNVGYLTLSLHRQGEASRRTVHSLVLEAFVGPRPEGYQACHGDGDRLNNHADNLRWDTVSANHADKILHGTNRKLPKTHCKRGHEFTPENTYTDGHGYRNCRTCREDWKREDYEKSSRARDYAREYYRKNYAVPESEKRPSATDINREKTVCLNGHKLESPNLMPTPLKSGRRMCLACSRGRAYANRKGLRSHLQEIADSYYQEIMRQE